MTRTEFYGAIAEQTGLPSKDVKAVFETAYEVALKALPTAGKLPVGTLGSLKLVQRKGRMGRNPATGETLKIPAKTLVKFDVAAPMRDAFLKPKKS